MKKIRLLVLLAATLLIAAQYATMFVIPNALKLTLGSAFWISFAYISIAYVASTLIIYFGLDEKRDASIHVGALLSVTCSYIALETVLANLFIYLPNIEFLPVFLSQLATFLVYATVAVMVLVGIFWKEKNAKVVEQKVNYINGLELNLSKAIGLVEDAEIKKQLESFKEKVHYSDPMSNEKCLMEEQKVDELCRIIAGKASENKFEEIPELVKEAERYLASRNQICLMTK